jgi:enamine deaminase RidA (YjgF/YER057c/UK114 family)
MTPNQVGMFGVLAAIVGALLFRFGYLEAAFWTAAVAVLTDMADFAAVNEVYCEAFGDHRPARSCVAVAALPLGALFEVEAIVHVG